MKSFKKLNNESLLVNEKNLNVLSLIKIAKGKEKKEKRDTYFLLVVAVFALAFTSIVITL
jgi:hypothetical protein